MARCVQVMSLQTSKYLHVLRFRSAVSDIHITATRFVVCLVSAEFHFFDLDTLTFQLCFAAPNGPLNSAAYQSQNISGSIIDSLRVSPSESKHQHAPFSCNSSWLCNITMLENNEVSDYTCDIGHRVTSDPVILPRSQDMANYGDVSSMLTSAASNIAVYGMNLGRLVDDVSTILMYYLSFQECCLFQV